MLQNGGEIGHQWDLYIDDIIYRNTFSERSRECEKGVEQHVSMLNDTVSVMTDTTTPGMNAFEGRQGPICEVYAKYAIMSLKLNIRTYFYNDSLSRHRRIFQN